MLIIKILWCILVLSLFCIVFEDILFNIWLKIIGAKLVSNLHLANQDIWVEMYANHSTTLSHQE